MFLLAGKLSQLTRLDAPDNHQLGSAGLQNLSCLQQLRHLDISWTGQLDEQGVAALQRLPQLQVLVAQWKQFTPSAICELGRMTGLRHLDISYSNAANLGSISLAAVVQLTKLTALHAQAPKQRRAAGADDVYADFGANLHQLAALTGLKQLDLARVPIVACEVPEFVTRLHDLQWLRIEGWCDRSNGTSSSSSSRSSERLAQGNSHSSRATCGIARDVQCSAAEFRQALQSMPNLTHLVMRSRCSCCC
jgi:hypothetical protein